MMHLTVRELTERKQVEEELDDSKRYLQALFDNSLDAILVTNDEGRYIDANPAACALLGYTHEELVQLSILDLTAEPFRQEGLAMWREFLASGSRSGEYSTRRKDGTIIQLEFRAVANILPGVHLSSSRDITERKRAEEAQREAEQKYRDIFENAAEGIFQTTPDGRFISANPALVKMLGFSSAEELIRQRADISNQHYVDPKRRAEFKRRMDEQGVVKGFELQAYRKDGSVIWLSENVRTVRDETGKVLYYEGTAWNITERQQANQSLRLFRNLIDRSSDAIEVIDPDTLHFLDCNKSAHQDLGYSREEFLSLRVYDIDPLIDGRMAARLTEEMERSGFVIFESIHRRKDGSTFPVEINLKIIRLERDYRLAVVRDITERKVAEEALRNAERKYRDIFENAVEGIFQIRPDGGYISANPALARMLGFDSPEELIQERSDPLKRRYVDPHRRQEYIRRLSEEGVVRDFEYEDYRKNGSRIWFSDNVHAVSDSEGTLLYYEGTTQDITERKLVERAQRESQRQYENLVHSIDGIVWEADQRTFTFTFVSKQAERILGYPLERWYEGPNFWPDHMHPEDRDWAVAYCVDATAKRVGHQFEYRMIAADGHVVWLSDIVTVDVADDESVLLRGVMVDITERKLIEEQLRQSESQLAEAQRLASVGSWNWDLRNNTQTWSDELYHIFGLDAQESDPSYGLFIKLVHPDDRAAISGAVKRALETQEPINSYLRIIRPDGAERIIHSRGNTIGDSCGTPNRMHGTGQDVTERKQAEDALREAERKYRDIFDNAGEGIFQSTPEGRYIAANPALARMHGFASPDELIRSRPDISRQIYVEPTRRDEFKRELEEQGAVRGFEHQVFRKDGSKIWISVNARAVRDDQGAIQYYEGTAQDITDRKRAEEALQESEERYRDLVENSLDLICTHDLDGLILSANRAAMELIGFSSGSEAGGTNFREILAPEVRDQFDDYLKRIQAEGVASGLMLVQTKSGEKRIWEYHNTLRTQGISTPIVRGMARDITERRRAEEALRESEARYRELFENAKDAIYVQDLSGKYTSVNRAAEKLSGYDRSEIIGKHFDQFVAPEYLPLVCAQLSKKLADGEQTAYEVEIIARDGRRVPVELSSAVIRKHGVAVGIQGIARDITEHKRAEETLRGYSRRLIEAQEAERQHIARELHDQIGQVLTAVRINLETIGNSHGTAEPGSLIDQGVGLIDAALEQVRNLSFELRPSLLDDLGLVAALRWYSDQYTQRTGIRTRSVTNLTERQSRLKQELETACFRIVQEALTNVVRHAKARNVLIDLNKVDHSIVLSIKDDGIGFDELTPYGGASAIRLGLRGMKERTLALGGTLKIQSSPSQGTEIRASFPAISNED